MPTNDMPESVKRELEGLRELCDRENITVNDVAQLIKCDADNLRASMERGSCPFGFGGKTRPRDQRRGFHVDRLALWCYLTGTKI